VDAVFRSIEKIQQAMAREKYIADRAMTTTIFLANALKKPVLLEGEAGVGKTEVAKVLARILRTKLIRLQCYEGLDANHALYEWNYPKQILQIQMAQSGGPECLNRDSIGKEIFSEEYLIKRPLLEAITSSTDAAPVLLIDEVDRADEEFEAFLLEVLSDFQISIPEIGTLTAKHTPFVILTSNRTREINDALKRRCLYLWISYPAFDREYEIVTTKVPRVDKRLAQQICAFMQEVRRLDFYKKPGIAETLDWAGALLALHKDALDHATVEETLGCIFKYNEDVEKVKGKQLDALLASVEALQFQMAMRG
jgi:MoxR-like ATPase